MNCPELFKCLDCGAFMSVQIEKLVCTRCAYEYVMDGAVMLAKPRRLNRLSQEEAHYHDSFDEDAKAVHQLKSLRNIKYHSYIWEQLKTLPPGANILEIGAGSGFDAKEIAGNYNLVLGDISAETLNRTAKGAEWPKTDFVALDGLHLPFVNNAFDAVYIVATLHHFEEPQLVAGEMERVLKSGGLAIVGIEPNYFYFNLIKKFRGLLCSLSHQKPSEGSHADAEMTGFKESELRNLFAEPTWELASVKPMWLFTGWVHYLSEFLFRALKLKKRWQTNQTLERWLINIDEALLKLPGVKRLTWHWIVVAKKR